MFYLHSIVEDTFWIYFHCTCTHHNFIGCICYSGLYIVHPRYNRIRIFLGVRSSVCCGAVRSAQIPIDCVIYIQSAKNYFLPYTIFVKRSVCTHKHDRHWGDTKHVCANLCPCMYVLMRMFDFTSFPIVWVWKSTPYCIIAWYGSIRYMRSQHEVKSICYFFFFFFFFSVVPATTTIKLGLSLFDWIEHN